jgi:hypothetical protein
MGNAEKLRAVLMKQRKKQASARLRTLLKQADGEAPKPPVPPNLTGPSSAPSRSSLMRGRPAAVQAPKPAATPNSATGGFQLNTNPSARYGLPSPVQRPVAVTAGPTIGAPNAPRMSPAASRLQQAAAQPPTQADTARNSQLAKNLESRYISPTSRMIFSARDKGLLTDPEYQAAMYRRTGIPGAFYSVEQGLKAMNSLWGAGYRAPFSESLQTAKNLGNAAGMHAMGAVEGRDPAAVALVMRRLAQGIPADKRLDLQNIAAANAQYTADTGLPPVFKTEDVARAMQDLVPGAQLTPEDRQRLFDRAQTYESARADELQQMHADPLIDVRMRMPWHQTDTTADQLVSGMADSGWSMAAIPGTSRFVTGAVGNAIKARGVPNALVSSAGALAPNVLQQLAAAGAPTKAIMPLSMGTDLTEMGAQNMRRTQPALGITANEPNTPEYYELKADELARKAQSPAVKLTSKPVVGADGTPQTQQHYEVGIPAADGSSPTQQVPANAANAAGLGQVLEAAAAGKGNLPDQKQVTEGAATTVTTSPMRDPISKSLAETGKAPEETATLAAKNLAAQGKNEDEIKSLTEWWGEPGNIATTLGIGASAVGLLMMFFGGQDGLMGWLMPALGLTMAAGGLGTLGYQGTFGKDIQNALQGAINPALPGLAASAHDIGFIPDETYNKMVLQNMTPEDIAALKAAKGTATYGNQLSDALRIKEDAQHDNWLARSFNAITGAASKAVNNVAPELSDEAILQGIQQQNPALYDKIMNQLSAKYRKQNLLPFLRGQDTIAFE